MSVANDLSAQGQAANRPGAMCFGAPAAAGTTIPRELRAPRCGWSGGAPAGAAQAAAGHAGSGQEWHRTKKELTMQANPIRRIGSLAAVRVRLGNLR